MAPTQTERQGLPERPARPSPGGRGRAAEERLQAAVLALLAERGYRRITIEDVSAASGVAKTTIYRRWAFKGEMIFDLAVHGTLPAFTASGDDLRGDLRQLCERVVAVTSSPVGRATIPGLIADMVDNPGLATRIDEAFIRPARAMIEGLLQRAVARGELPDDGGAAQIHAAVLGTACAWQLLAPEDRPDDLAERLADQAMALLRPRRGA